MKYDDHNSVINGLKKAQDAESDQRHASREAQLFVTKRDGQWDPYVWSKLDGQFRGTFDMTNPIIDSIAGEIEQSDFTLRVSPASGEASEDTARTFDGLIRNIRNMSNAEYVFDRCARANIVQGFDAVEIYQDYVKSNSFDQDLLIKRIPDALDSVWFDPSSLEQTREDAKWVVVLNAITKDEYDSMFPEGSGMSVSTDMQAEAYTHKPESVIVGRILYKKKSSTELVKLSDGSVYEFNEDYESTVDERERQGITEVDRRTKKTERVYSRMFDGSKFLTDEEETVFSLLPIVPIYGNFDIVENKIVYSGKVEKLYDEQRSLNYLMSRSIQDGAISPSPTVWMTEAMAEGHDYSNMNTDRAGVRFYNVDDDNPGLTPQYTGGPQVSPGLQQSISDMQQMISITSGTFNAQQGNASPVQSGVAGAAQIDQGNLGNTKWFKSPEIMICQVGKVLLDAMPRVYDVRRQIRIVGEDGTGKMTTINDVVFDTQAGKEVELNNLTKGQYDVFCETGPAFANQQREAAQAFLEAASQDPTLMEIGSDVWIKSQQTPEMKDIADRKRAIAFNQGYIPEEQWTDEERQKVAEQQALAAQQPPQEDPNLLLAQAEQLKGQADIIEQQNKQIQIQNDAQLKQQDQQIRMAEIQLKQQEFERAGNAKFNTDLINADQNQQKIDLQAQQQQFNQMMETMQLRMDEQKAELDELKTQADTWKVIKETSGVDAVISPTTVEAIEQQGEIVTNSQEEQE